MRRTHLLDMLLWGGTGWRLGNDKSALSACCQVHKEWSFYERHYVKQVISSCYLRDTCQPLVNLFTAQPLHRKAHKMWDLHVRAWITLGANGTTSLQQREGGALYVNEDGQLITHQILSLPLPSRLNGCGCCKKELHWLEVKDRQTGGEVQKGLIVCFSSSCT